jgi:nucleoid DNA-binding protein
MTRADIVKEVSENTGLTQVETETVLNGILQSISHALNRGERVDLRGFGSFLVKQRAAGVFRNPATQEKLNLQERYVPVFKASKLMKEIVNKSMLRGF